MTITITVLGKPAPGGSKRYVGHGRIIEDCKRTAGWRECVVACALAKQVRPVSGPLIVTCEFIMPRPKSHFRRDGNLSKTGSDAFHTKKPDTTKLWRSTEDALSGVAWVDDAQIISQKITKRYTVDGEPCGAIITITELP